MGERFHVPCLNIIISNICSPKYNDHDSIVKMLLDRNPDLVYDEDEASNTALHLAATYGHPEVAEILINKRADAEAR